MTIDVTTSIDTNPVNNAGFDVSLGKDAINLSNPADLSLPSHNLSLKNNRSIARLKLLDTARRILARHDIKSSRGNKHRTRNCHAVPAHNRNIYITLNSDDSASAAGVSGVQTCGSICSCPVCATNKMIEHGNNIRKALIYAEQNNLRPVMMTLTARHTRQMTLKYFRDAFRDAYNEFQRHRDFRALKDELGIIHQITSREITHGKHGWHYHMHILFFVRPHMVKHAQSRTEQAKSLTSLWLSSLENNGLDATESNALDLSSGKNNKTYLAKLGYDASPEGDLAFELTGNENKGKTVWDLLAMAHYGDIGAESLYIEYVQTMSGHKWITYSKDIKRLSEDIELDEETTPDNQKLHNWMEVDSKTWYAVARLNKVSHVVKYSAKTRSRQKVRCLLNQLSDEWYLQERIH